MFELNWLKLSRSIFDNNLKDNSDVLNSIITTIILLCFVTLTSFKSYLLSPITCFSSNAPFTSNLDKYIEAFCWIRGTVVLKEGDTPQSDFDWKSNQRIGYYQWIPFLLLIQCGLFYIPNFIWNVACRHNHGTDLIVILKRAKELSEDCSDVDLSSKLTRSLEELFFTHRDFRQDLMSQINRKVHRKCKFIITSKRLANKLSLSYLLMKLLYICNGLMQIFLMKTFLSIDSWLSEAYLTIFGLLWSGDDWTVSKYFPRVTFCRVNGIRSVGVSDNVYVAQCVLPVNMLNEKIFIFLFVWISLVCMVTCFSFLIWIFKMGNTRHQVKQVKTYLKMRMTYKKMDQLIVQRFVQHFLRMDGVFLLCMIKSHAGDVVTSMITNGLYQTYYQKYRHQDFGNDKLTEENDSLSLKLEPGGKGSVKTHFAKASAPEKKFFL